MLLFSQSTAAHPGRTDSNGGHYDRSTGEYHYHTGEYAGRVSSGSSDSSAENKIEKPVKENKLHIISPFYALVLKDSHIIKNKLTAASVIFAVLLVSIFTTNSFILSRLGIYSLKFERTGSFCYYVKAQNLSTKKTYTLPASVYVDIPSDEETYLSLTIEELFFPNGSSIELDYDILEIKSPRFPDFSISHSLKKPIVLEASDYNYGNISEWKCMLTNRHVDNPPFEETSRKKAIPSLLIHSLTLLYAHITTVYAIKSDLRNTKNKHSV